MLISVSFVCTQSKSLNTPTLLRSYTTRDSVDGFSTHKVKIWEAARATSAASTFFDPIRIGLYEFVDGATGRNNPVETVLAEANSLWKDAGSRIQCLISIGTGMSQFRDFGNNLAEMKRTLVTLATETEDTEQRVYRNQENLGVGGRYFRFNVDRGLESVSLDEYEKQGTIVAATEAYLGDPRVSDVVNSFIQAKAPLYALVTETDREKYLSWLPYLDPRANHNRARDLRTDRSTGQWFLQGKFETWVSEPKSFMWLHAKGESSLTVPAGSSYKADIQCSRFGQDGAELNHHRHHSGETFRRARLLLLFHPKRACHSAPFQVLSHCPDSQTLHPAQQVGPQLVRRTNSFSRSLPRVRPVDRAQNGGPRQSSFGSARAMWQCIHCRRCSRRVRPIKASTQCH